MMKRVDTLSKQNTRWVLRQVFQDSILTLHGVTVILPDLARCGPTVLAIVARGRPAAIVLPRWEAQSWWNVVIGVFTLTLIEDIRSVVFRNGDGFPMWEFVLAVFP